jgi:hypothetical protein
VLGDDFKLSWGDQIKRPNLGEFFCDKGHVKTPNIVALTMVNQETNTCLNRRGVPKVRLW